MEIIKQQSLNKPALRNALKEFIEDSRQNIENKTNTINIVLQTMKEENESLISKSKNKYILIFIIYFNK
jgi:hypothetical protein